MDYDVIIIGAGIVGTSLARELTKYRTRVLVLEKEADVSMGATKANSAIVHGGYAEKHSTLKGKLCYQGRTQFRKLDEELNFGFRESGALVMTFEDKREILEMLLGNGRQNGLTDLRIIDSEEIRKMEPALNPDVRYALYCEGAGVCSPYGMCIAMAENAVMNGASLELSSEVTEIEKEGDRFLVRTDRAEYRSRFVVNAAGVHSDRVSKMAGVGGFRILPRSGEYLLFARGTGEPIHSVIFQLPTKFGKGVLLTSTYYGNLLIGPDARDEEEKEDTSTHMERVAEILRQSKVLYDGINPMQFIRSFTGIRARSSTEDFIIEETDVKGFVNAAGIQSPGLTASPAIAQMLVGILKEAGLDLVPNEHFNPYRKPVVAYRKLKPLKEVQHLIDMPEGNPERIVCRCEQVTEAEIVDALHREVPVRTVDGVKRRTRASMGWCQGDFCRKRIIGIMERELGLEIDPSFDIEHSGVSRVGKSELVEYLKGIKEEE
ncbi:MAG TPA: NAD(P)/FAD-dependent oxidoreductase [Clostridiaceae bacterium]|nr:NAD(P)/FAD-dependent oxidoreductase [Clostridiaceae bacterium]